MSGLPSWRPQGRGREKAKGLRSSEVKDLRTGHPHTCQFGARVTVSWGQMGTNAHLQEFSLSDGRKEKLGRNEDLQRRSFMAMRKTASQHSDGSSDKPTEATHLFR